MMNSLASPNNSNASSYRAEPITSTAILSNLSQSILAYQTNLQNFA